MEVANIWSRLLKHNWWDPLYGRIRIHSNVFSDFIFNENLSLYYYISWSIVRRPNFSSCMRMISNHDLYFIVVDRSSLSERLKIDRTEIIRWNWSSSAFRGLGKIKIQLKKNEFYEWGIWRTIMKTMSENSSICIKINSWFHRVPSALFSINRLSFYSIFFYQPTLSLLSSVQ